MTIEEISDEEIQREMDYSDELRNKLKEFKEEKEERKFEVKELEKTLDWITYNHSNPNIFKGGWEKMKIGKGYRFSIDNI